MKSKILFLVTLLSVLFVCSIAFCQATIQEEITLSTYYPAPYGEYDELCAEKVLVWRPDGQELADMSEGDCHIGWSLIVGAGGTGFSYDELGFAGLLPGDGDVLIKGNVGIGTASPQAQLEVASTNSGFLAPRFADHAAIVAAMPSPAEGMMAYNLADHVMEYYNGTNWVPVGGAGTIFGSWTDKDSSNNALVKDAVYSVTSDGFLVSTATWDIWAYSSSSYADVKNSSVSALKAVTGSGTSAQQITLPVKSGDYWKTTGTFGQTIYWLPIGNGQCVKQP